MGASDHPPGWSKISLAGFISNRVSGLASIRLETHQIRQLQSSASEWFLIRNQESVKIKQYPIMKLALIIFAQREEGFCWNLHIEASRCEKETSESVKSDTLTKLQETSSHPEIFECYVGYHWISFQVLRFCRLHSNCRRIIIFAKITADALIGF